MPLHSVKGRIKQVEGVNDEIFRNLVEFYGKLSHIQEEALSHFRVVKPSLAEETSFKRLSLGLPLRLFEDFVAGPGASAKRVPRSCPSSG